MSSIASMDDARAYFEALPEQLEPYFDEAYQNAFQHVMDTFAEFFKITASIDEKARNQHVILPHEATDIGAHGLTQLLKMIDLMEKLDLPYKRQEIEQIALIFATWVLQYDGKITLLEPIVNAFAHAANQLSSKQSLTALCHIMMDVSLACSDEIKQDFDSTNLYRPWRLLLINQAIVATKSHDPKLVQQAYNDLIRYLPHDAPAFFQEGLDEMDEKGYPEKIKSIIVEYANQSKEVRLH